MSRPPMEQRINAGKDKGTNCLLTIGRDRLLTHGDAPRGDAALGWRLGPHPADLSR